MIAQVSTQDIPYPIDEVEGGLVPVNDGVRAIDFPAPQQGTDWLYFTTRRLSLDNKTRRGFLNKATDTIIEELICQITNAAPLNSHRNPGEDEPGPRHMDSLEWCESRNTKVTSVRGYSCGQCPAATACSWKIELTLVLPDEQTGNAEEYLLTLPTASSVRFRQVAQLLFKRHGKKIEDVAWRGTVYVEENKERRLVYPVANFEPFDPTNGTLFDLSENKSAVTQRPAPRAPQATAPQPTRAPAPTPIMRVDPVKAGRQAQAAQQAVATMPKASALTAGIRPDKGDAEDATEALNDLAEAHSKNKPPNDAKMGVIRQATAIELGKTMLKDDKLRHAFLSHHYPDAAPTGSLTELGWIELLSLRDWAGRKDAKAYIEWWVKDHNANKLA